MKNYFAKLAARATPANAPASSTVTAKRVADPFEASSLLPPTPAPAPSAIPLDSHTDSLKPSQIAAVTKEPRPMLEPPKSNEPTAFERSSPPGSNETTEDGQLEVIEPSRLEPLKAPATEVKPTTPHIERPSSAVDTLRSRTSLAPPVETSPARSLVPAEETGRAESDDLDQVQEHLAEIDNQHLALQRKADVFMQQLFRREPTADESETRSKSDEQKVVRPENKVERPTLLLPASRTAPVQDREPERPSLTIGKLTVEVMPPAPQPATPRSPVVIVRGGRSGSVTTPSSRRFGLGQF